MSKNPYNPSSFFFVDHTNLSDPVSGNTATDAYGPVLGDETNKFRTTSVIRASSDSRVFAICDGHLFIQPNDDDNDKINLILKPSVSYAPFKIKYFVYRGVNKSDLIDGTNLKAVNINSPDFLQRIWGDYIAFNTIDGSPAPTTFPSKLIGYDPANQVGDSLINSYFFSSSNDINTSFEIPKCNGGEWLGNFSGQIGLDIVLDYGDFDLDYEEQLFRFDLDYARQSEQVFDVNTVTGAVEQKRLREYILQFIDAAAFWGSHADSGEIMLYNDSDHKTTVEEIYPPIVAKYQSKNNVYLSVRAERSRSYNYFSDYPVDNIHFELASASDNYVPYLQNSWPILIKEFNQSSGTPEEEVKIKLKGVFAPGINAFDRHFPVYFLGNHWVSDNFLSSPIFEFPIKVFNSSGSDYLSVSGFSIVNYLGVEENPMIPYYRNLFGPINIKGVFDIPLTTTDKFGYWVCNCLNRVKNLNEINKFKNSILNTKVVFDTGNNGTTNKKRRLYISYLTDLSDKNKEYNVGSYSSGFNKSLKDFYVVTIYNDPNFTIYKGEINDSGILNSLGLVNQENYFSKQTYFQLGILEEEFNKLMFDSVSVPSPPPPIPHIPADAVTRYFYLDELTPSATDDFRKFKVGVEFENGSGDLEVKYPSLSNEVIVYTVDGFYFFTSGFSEFQDVSETFAGASVRFRPKPDWNGEYGIDWLRINDSGLPGDSGSNKYFDLIGHYYNPGPPREKLLEPTGSASTITLETVEWHSLNRRFLAYPQKLGDFTQYNTPVISLYPLADELGTLTGFPKTTASGKQICRTEAILNLKIAISTVPTGLKIRYEKNYFNVLSIPSSDTTTFPDPTDPTNYSCLEINDKTATGSSDRNIELKIISLKEFKKDKVIQIIATEGSIEKIAGELLIKANAKTLRKQGKVLFVNVKSDIDGVAGEEEGFNITGPTPDALIDSIVSFFNQALIDIIEIEKVDLDLNNPSGNTFLNTYVDTLGFHYTNGPNNFHKDMYDQLKSSSVYLSKYEDYMKIFYFGFRDTNSSGGIISGAADPLRRDMAVVCVFKDGILKPGSTTDVMQTSAHELLHVVGLNHTFNAKNNFTFEIYYSDNIMDYQDPAVSPPNRVSISSYQEEVFEANRKFTDEK